MTPRTRSAQAAARAGRRTSDDGWILHAVLLTGPTHRGWEDLVSRMLPWLDAATPENRVQIWMLGNPAESGGNRRAWLGETGRASLGQFRDRWRRLLEEGGSEDHINGRNMARLLERRRVGMEELPCVAFWQDGTGDGSAAKLHLPPIPPDQSARDALAGALRRGLSEKGLAEVLESRREQAAVRLNAYTRALEGELCAISRGSRTPELNAQPTLHLWKNETRAVLDGANHSLTEDQHKFITTLAKANGTFVPSSEIPLQPYGSPRLDRLRRRLPGRLPEVVESRTGSSGGYRLVSAVEWQD